jgi:putative redox protein
MKKAVARQTNDFTHRVELRQHELTVDEPEDKGGHDEGPTPQELLAASLASCTAITMEMYADRKEWELGQVEVAVDYGEPTPGGSPTFQTSITIPAELTDDQRERILVIAGKCPVHKALAAQDVEIEDSLSPFEA